MNENFNQGANPNQNPYPPAGPAVNAPVDYTQFGGWLLAAYWCMIIGGVLTLLGAVIPALISIASLLLLGVVYFLGSLVSLASITVSAVFFIRAASQMNARNPKFFDTYAMGVVISLVGSIASDLLHIIGGGYGVGSFIGSTIGIIIGTAIGLCLSIMYFSKSVRVGVYFNGRPLQYSRYWAWIKLLPDFIISDSMPRPENFQQMGRQPQQQYAQPQQAQPYMQPQSQGYAQQQAPAQPYAAQPQQQYAQPQQQQYAPPQAPVQPQQTYPQPPQNQ